MVRSSLYFVALSLLLTACPKAKPPPPAVDDPPSTESVVAIDGVEPRSTQEGRGVTVTITGRGFLEGAEIFLGSRKAPGVDVISESELTFRATDALPAGRYDLRLVRPDGDAAERPGGFEVIARVDDAGDCELVTVLFEFNESKLSERSRGALADNARCIERRGFAAVRLEGHADERGSTMYNLSLGQRRAESVKTYLQNLGIDADVLATMSYGEERPQDMGHGEQAWRVNRRVEFVVP